jgi:type II secretory pathway pseudopilin PulG
MARARSSIRATRGEAGFSLAELSVSLLVTVILLLAVLALFDFSSRVARVQTNLTDMQQALRVALYDTVRTVRMAGRGGLPLGNPPTGLAVSVRDNVPANSHIGGPLTPPVLAGTDVLTVRGVFSAPLFQVNSADPGTFKLPAGGNPGEIWISATTPTGIPQDLTALKTAVQSSTPEALILVSPRDASIYAVVELDPADSVVNDPGPYKIAFVTNGGLHTADYVPLSAGGAVSPDLTTVAFVGILEEHRYYVREAHAIPANPASDLTPRLSRARVFPGTQASWRPSTDLTPDADYPGWQRDISDNILDFQVAMGFDSVRGGGSMTQDDDDVGDDDRIWESADGKNDDWLFNDNDPVNPALWLNAPLYYLRLSVLARTDRRDHDYQGPTVARVENHDVSAAALNGRTERMYHRRLLQTVVDMRNLG